MNTSANFQLALVTGSSSGLGLALTKELTKRKIPYFAPKRSDGFDLTVATDRKKLLSYIEENTPDLIINCAGFGLYGKATDLSIEEQLSMIDLNIKATVEITLTAAKALLKKDLPGTVVNISSASSFFPWPEFATYAATKTFISNFSESLDYELRKEKIRVLTVCPGMFHSNFASKASKGVYIQESPLFSLPTEKIVKEIFLQIEKGKSLHIPSWRYQWMIRFFSLFPRKIQFPLLALSIKRRIKKRDS